VKNEKRNKTRNNAWSLCLGFTFLCFFTTSAQAEGNWWDKGLDLLNEYASEGKITEPTLGEIGGAFKDALEIGSGRVVKQLGQENGFNTDASIHIPLPKNLKTMKSWLDKVGLGGQMDELELKLNRAAEAATPKAKQLFIQAIKDMTFSDVKRIYDGPNDAATQYFRGKMSPFLTEQMRPIVTKTISQVGALKAYEEAVDDYKSLPFVPDVRADLTQHVLNKGLDGIFYYMAKEEADIRKNPARHTTDLLKKVFGQ